MASIKKFEEIQAWQVARELCGEIYIAYTNNNSFSKDFDLRSQ